MREVRTVLGEIRGTEHPVLPRSTTWCGRLPAALQTVTMRRHGDLDGVPGPIGRVAYRVVQESLTNPGRHAGPRPGDVAGDRTAAARVEVVDDGLGADARQRRRRSRPGRDAGTGRGRRRTAGGGSRARRRLAVRAELPAGRPEEAR